MPEATAAEKPSVHRTRAVDRLIAITDGVVAVAVTLLALPLIDIAPADGDSVWQMFAKNSGAVLAFLFTFAVVGVMWTAHNRILNGIRDFDGTIFWLNAGWLATIVLLPWFSSLFGNAEWTGAAATYPGVGLLYWGAMALVSFLGLGISLHLGRHPELLAQGVDPAGNRGVQRGAAFGLYFLVIGVVSLFAPTVSAYLPFGIIVISIWLGPARTRSNDPTEETA